MPTSGKLREKSDQSLAEHIKKALSTAEAAPKQKHVRACIVYTWDYQSSSNFWACLRMQPVLTDQVVCYKALITIHKVLVGGPHIVLGEALGQANFFESCIRQHGSVTLGYGYGPLIQAYCEFLLAKLEFHRTHPEFTGNFDYEEYVSLKGVSNLDEGYQTIERLMELAERVDRFQRTVFINVRPMIQNECRIASLVPLVEESYGIYKFITSMLSAMHLCVESADPLVPLVERYNGQFWALKKFYGECETLRYLTSLIEIPKLPDQPPSFGLGGPDAGKRPSAQQERTPPPAAVPKPKSPLPSLRRAESADLLGDLDDSDVDSSSLDISRPQSGGTGLEQLHTHTVTTVPVVDEQTLAALRQAQSQVTSLSQQFQEALQRHQHDQGLLQQYDEQLRLTRQQLEQMAAMQADNTTGMAMSSSREIADLSEQVRQWRSKYEAMAREAAKWKAKYEGMAALYQQLRSEHLEALSKLRDLQAERDSSDAARAAAAKAEQDMAASLGDRLAEELLRVSQAIEAAAQRLESMRADPSLSKLSSLNAAVHSAIVDGAATITTAIGNLIRYAIKTQAEIVAAGKGSGTPDAFYRKHSQWTNGLISAAQAVAAATMTLVETADGVIRGTRGLQHLVAASNSVAAATMQLVTASRVKAPVSSQAQPLLETAAKAVTDANRRLVDSATSAIGIQGSEQTETDVLPSDPFSIKVEELERQARVLALEKELSLARNDLVSLRKAAYSRSDEATPIHGSTGKDPSPSGGEGLLGGETSRRKGSTSASASDCKSPVSPGSPILAAGAVTERSLIADEDLQI